MTAIDDTRNHLAYIVTLAAVLWHDAVEVAGVVAWWLSRVDVPGNVLAPVEVGDNAAADGQGMFVVERVVIGDAGDTTMHVCTTQVLCADLFARCGLDEWGTGQEDGAI